MKNFLLRLVAELKNGKPHVAQGAYAVRDQRCIWGYDDSVAKNKADHLRLLIIIGGDACAPNAAVGPVYHGLAEKGGLCMQINGCILYNVDIYY